MRKSFSNTIFMQHTTQNLYYITGH